MEKDPRLREQLGECTEPQVVDVAGAEGVSRVLVETLGTWKHLNFQIPSVLTDSGMDWRQREKYQSTSVHDAYCAVGWGDQVETSWYGRPGNTWAGEKGVQEGCAGGAPR